MSIFDWLLVGHLVGDWVLQSDWMAKGKKQGLFTWPGFIHFAIYAVIVTVSLWVADGGTRELLLYLGLGTIIFVSHWLIDATSIVSWWMGMYGQGQEFVRIIVDQTLHILILALVAAFSMLS